MSEIHNTLKVPIADNALTFNPDAMPEPDTLSISMTRDEHRIADELYKALDDLQRVIIDVDGEKHEFSADSLVHESYKDMPAELDYIEDKSQWYQIFGSPERAARTLEHSCHLMYGLKVDGFVSCIGCPVYDEGADVDDCCYDALLEWLRGDAR